MKRNWKSLMVSGTVLTVLAGALTLPALASVGQRTAALHYQNIKVTLDGRTLDLTDSRGNEVEPFTIDGTTYLPLASISKALGMDVRWDADTNTVILNTKGTGTTAAESYIGVERAKEIALKDAGLSASQVSFVRAGLDWDNGRMEYEVEFWKDNVEYDYEIDAYTGTILHSDRDIEGYSIPAQSSADIGADRAKEIALDHAGVSASKATFVRAHLDYEDGRRVYDVEFYSGNQEYDYEINAVDGTILSYDNEVDYREGQAQSSSQTDSAAISENEAKQAAFDHAGVAEADVTGLRIRLDYDDGRQVYDVEFYSGSKEYDYEISASDGSVLSFDQEMDEWAAAQNAAGTQNTTGQAASITETDARALALEQVPGATDENIVKFAQDYDDGRTVYEIEIIYNRAEYDIEIDASTGTILKMEQD